MISSGQDLIGCITEPVDFVAGGTCEEQLMGMCETLWEPKMKPDQLFECISQVLLHVYDLIMVPLPHFRSAPFSFRSDQHVSLFTVQAVMNAMDRDAISGWGAVVHIIEKNKVNFAPN